MKLQYPNKSDYKLIFLMAVNYSAIIIFPAYGPILSLYASQDAGLLLSTLFLFSISANLVLLPRFHGFLASRPSELISLSSVVLVMLFPTVGFSIKVLTFLLLGFVSARFIILWSIAYLEAEIESPYSKFFTAMLFLSYAVLYAFNVLAPDLPKSAAVFPPAMGFLLIAILSPAQKNRSPIVSKASLAIPFRYLVPVFLVYISAGITYAGIYPVIDHFVMLERFYNVLPFLAALPAVFWVHQKFGPKALLLTGLSLLGFSFLFHVFDLSPWNYFMIQTLLQAGWAFMNSFVWIFASNISRINRNPFYFSSILAAFLSGTFIGSALFLGLSSFIGNLDLTFLGLVPLLGVLIFIQFIPNDLRTDMAAFESAQLEHLTQREKEIFLLLLNNMKGKEIAERLSISPNTLKKHCGKIYGKLEVENKTELIKVFGHMKKS